MKPFHQQGGIIMKKTIVTVACTLIALLAFAQPGSKGTKTTTESIMVTGTIIPSAIENRKRISPCWSHARPDSFKDSLLFLQLVHAKESLISLRKA
jgi:hypothetical protein